MERKKNKKPGKRPDKKPENTPNTVPDTTHGNRQDKKIRIAVLLLAVVVLGCAAIFGIYLLNMSPSSTAKGTGSHTVTVYYFYGAECPHCQNVRPYVDSLRQKYPDVNFQILEIWHDETNNARFRLLNHNLNQPSTGVPEVIVGGVVLYGENEIRAGLEPAILQQKGNLTRSSQLAAVPVSGSSAGTNATITATYFYGDGCIHCEKIKPFIADLETRYPELRIEKLECNHNTTNYQRFQAMNRQYGIINSSGFPTVFIGRNASSGETEVRDHFEEYILAEKQRIATGTPENPVNLTPDNPGSQPETPALDLYFVVFAALVDSINPCAFAVLIILLAYLTSLGERRRIAVVGCTYIATVFIVYFVAGLGLLTFIQGIGLTGIVFTFAAVVAIITGLINIAEVLLKREIFTLAIPVSQKDAIDRYIKKASVPSAIVLGALVAMVELPCTGGIYLAILGLLGDRMTLAEGIPYLLFYNLIFVLPLILILIVMYWAVLRSVWRHSVQGASAGCALSWALSWLRLGQQCFLG